MALTDNLGFAKAYPELAFLESMKISKNAGSDNVMAGTASKAFSDRQAQLTGGNTSKPILSPETLSGLRSPVTPLDPNSSKNDIANLAAARAPIDSARSDILQGFVNSYNQADELANIDEGQIKKKLLFEMQPTQDIDSRVKQLTTQSLVSKALLNDQYKDLPPAQRRALVADRLKVFSDTVDNLLAVRQKRLDVIDNQVSEQVSTMQRKEKALTTRQSLLEKMSAELEKMGGSREDQTMAQITLTKARTELDQMRKKMANSGVSGGLGTRASGPFTTEEENAFQLASQSADLPIDFFTNLFGEGKGAHVTNATIRYQQWKEQKKPTDGGSLDQSFRTPGAFDVLQYGK